MKRLQDTQNSKPCHSLESYHQNVKSYSADNDLFFLLLSSTLSHRRLTGSNTKIHFALLTVFFMLSLYRLGYELEMNPLSLSGFDISIPVDKRKLIVNDDTKTE
jgi:hypothetical protein